MTMPVGAAPLTDEEQVLLQAHGPVRVCVDPDWKPFEFIDELGRHEGMAADLLKRMAEHTGIVFEVVPTRTWQESIERAKSRDCDIFSLAMATPERRTYMNFTRPYLSFPFVIATRDEEMFVEDLDQVLDKPLAMVKGYAYVELLRTRHPGIDITEVNNIDEGLEKVRRGEVFGLIDTLATLSYAIQQQRLFEVKIAGRFDDRWALAIGVRNDRPEWLPIFEKAIDTLTAEDFREVENRWLAVRMDAALDYRLIAQVAAVILVVLMFLGWRHIELGRYARALKKANAELKRLSRTDALTGVANRHALDLQLRQEQTRVERYGGSFSLILIDIDHFKRVNDTQGHLVGDRVLKAVADRVVSMVREADMVGRWGGEEFLVFCPNTHLAGAGQVAEKVRKALRDADFGLPMPVTVSLGVAEFRRGERPESTISRADEALYQAKAEGRDRVVCRV
ncbi:MAG: diguanylate cyclase [Pseudomonadota bacterium]